MSLVSLIAALRSHPSILVTGPQRSGTTISAKVLAQELGHDFINEHAIIRTPDGQACEYDDVNLAKDVLGRGKVVLQAPALAHVCHTLDCAVVFCHRPLPDILASQERMGWWCEKYELSKYNLTKGVIAEVKYRVWGEWQRQACAAAFDLHYEWLEGHPLFVSQERRMRAQSVV